MTGGAGSGGAASDAQGRPAAAEPMSSTRVQGPGFRPYWVQVIRREPLSPHYIRLVFAGPDLDVFGTDGYDQRIKVMLPLPDGRSGVGGRWGDPLLWDDAAIERATWYAHWRQLPPEDRNPFRTYTIRRIDPVRRELTVDFVLHPHPGPAGRFAEAAQPGDVAVVIGPDARSERSALGIDFHSGVARRVLLVGDETAVPAILATIESLARNGRLGERAGGTSSTGAPETGALPPVEVHAVLEVPDEHDVLSVDASAIEGLGAEKLRRVHVSWAARGESAAPGSTLLPRVRSLVAARPDLLPGVGPGARASVERPGSFDEVDVDETLLWEAPEEDDGASAYVWIAGEAAAVRDVRRLLVRDLGVDRHRVAFMGYWRQGKAEAS